MHGKTKKVGVLMAYDAVYEVARQMTISICGHEDTTIVTLLYNFHNSESGKSWQNKGSEGAYLALASGIGF